MPLFECDNCHVVDNTAVGNFWARHMHNKSQLCAACDPEIRKWHDVFPQRQYSDYVLQFGVESVLYPSKVREHDQQREAGARL